MAKFQSTKVFDVFSSVFRQWLVRDSRCKYLAGVFI